MPWVATRAMTVFGEKYQPGQVIPIDRLHEGSARGLINLGRVRRVDEPITVRDFASERPKAEVRHIGGPWFELPSGRKVMGKVAAQKALQEES